MAWIDSNTRVRIRQLIIQSDKVDRTMCVYMILITDYQIQVQDMIHIYWSLKHTFINFPSMSSSPKCCQSHSSFHDIPLLYESCCIKGSLIRLCCKIYCFYMIQSDTTINVILRNKWMENACKAWSMAVKWYIERLPVVIVMGMGAFLYCLIVEVMIVCP